MFEKLASNLIVTSTSMAYTRAVELTDANGLEANIEILSESDSATNLDAFLEISNDCQSWTQQAILIDEGAPGVYFEIVGGICARFVRMAFITATGIAIVAAAVRTAEI